MFIYLFLMYLWITPASPGVVIETVAPIEKSDLREGDLLLSWSLDSGDSGVREGKIEDIYHFWELEYDLAPRGAFYLHGKRRGAPIKIAMSPGKWRVRARPVLPDEILRRYQPVAALLKKPEDLEKASVLLENLASDMADPITASWFLYRAAQAHVDGNRRDGAIPYFKQAYESVKSVPESRAYNELLEGFAYSYMRTNQLEESERLLSAALELRRRHTPSLSESNVLFSLGTVSWFQEDFREAEARFEKGYALRKQLAPMSLPTAEGLVFLGTIKHQLGNLVDSELHYRKALQIQKELEPVSFNLSTTLGNLGDISLQRGNIKSAELFFLQKHEVLEQIKDVNGLAQLELLKNWDNLGEVYLKSGDLDQAETFFRKSMQYALSQPDHQRSLVENYLNMGAISLLREENLEATTWFRKADDIQKKLGPGGPKHAGIMLRLGQAAAASNNLQKAEAHFRSALKIVGAHLPNTSRHAELAYELAGLYRKRGDQALSLAHYFDALNAVEAQLTLLGGPAEGQWLFLNSFAGYFKETIAYLVELERFEEAFHVSERYRSRIFLHVMLEANPEEDLRLPKALVAKLKANTRAYEKKQNELLGLDPLDKDQINQYHGDLERLRQEHAVIEREMKLASPHFSSFVRPDALDYAQTRKTLETDTLMVSYITTSNALYLFPVAADRPAKGIKIPVSEAELEQLTRDFRRYMNRPESQSANRFMEQAGERLFEHLIQPVLKDLASYQRLVVVPDGPLHLLPFHALKDEKLSDGRYLTQMIPSQAVMSATVRHELKKRAEKAGNRADLEWMGFGRPVYPDQETQKSWEAILEDHPEYADALRSNGRFRSLPFSEKEVRDVAALYPDKSMVFIGEEAREAAVKASAGRAKVLHFACHGIFDAQYPLNSALVLTLPRQMDEGSENGFLQAWEIMELRLNADLVVLSACDTALGGDMGGDGLLGLTRAFHHAGAASVLASLWTVSEYPTALFMKRFYQYRTGISNAQALRKARLYMLGAEENTGLPLSHPYYWAAFQLNGYR